MILAYNGLLDCSAGPCVHHPLYDWFAKLMPSLPRCAAWQIDTDGRMTMWWEIG
jgi:hypothetical protein